MATTSLLQFNPYPFTKTSKPPFTKFSHFHLRTLPTHSTHFHPLRFYKFPKKFALRCFNSMRNNSRKPSFEFDCDSIGAKLKSMIPFSFGVFAESLLKAVKTLRKPAVVAVILGLLLMYDPNSALAASGGRMGGRSFSSGSSSSSRSYRTAPSGGLSYSAPYFGPSPFSGGGVYVGPAVGVGVGAGSSFFLILMGFAAFMLVSGFLSDRSEGVLTATDKTTVLKLQIGLLGMARELQRDLNLIAETADTSTTEGLSYILTETTLALLRHPDYCISGYSSVDVKRSIEEGEKRFNRLSLEERGKFDEETLVNVNNIKKQSTTSHRVSGFRNEYIVITILVAAEGVHKLPTINGSGDLKEALQKLGSIPSSRTLAVEVLWTPQNENDTLSERELLEDYPLLRPL
ncbi:hypothetical protein VitviT2T_021241 [Vitis vinifera]|uniref:Myelin-associated oligodendrocyte basic protein n=2 Tax=Vitis vinifera TaxID=29760 RepID=A0ABY9D6W4_VITVI|nr:uncharacterized protein LOC100854337 [Vitis vinifera]WKA03111.1 hypothetical protein VitviT2T_021241 [Vitis vinifera]|eukprot:XP_003633656.2 PREDICTED: uncharacterized protein LOC100854337 isoform X2 [Vitis vinifera]